MLIHSGKERSRPSERTDAFLFRIGLFLVLLATIRFCVGCAAKQPTLSPDPGASGVPEDCVLVPGTGDPAGRLIVALTDPIGAVGSDRRVAAREGDPFPPNQSTRLIRRHLAQTLVTVDCRGEVQPGLADSWTSKENDRVWEFHIPLDARFSDGSKVRAADVRLSWMLRRRDAKATGRIFPWVWLGQAGKDAPRRRADRLDTRRFRAVQIVDEQTLRITLEKSMPDLPLRLAHPDLFIAVPRPGRAWPVGTGPYSLEVGAGGSGQDLLCVSNSYYGETRHRWDPLTFRSRPDWDPRDLPSTGADLFLVRDRQALGYFSLLPEYRTRALPWDRNYFLLMPSPFPGLADRLLKKREELAAVVIASDGAALTDWWFDRFDDSDESGASGESGDPASSSHGSRAGCGLVDRDLLLLPGEESQIGALDSELGDSVPLTGDRFGNTRSPGRPLPTIVYPASDPDAARIAARIAALGPEGGWDRPVVTSGLDQHDYDQVLRKGEAFAFVARMNRECSSGCLDLQSFLSRAPWLIDGASGFLSSSPDGNPSPTLEDLATHLIESGASIPLVRTRPHVVYRRGLVGLRVDGSGKLLLDQAGWSSGVELP